MLSFLEQSSQVQRGQKSPEHRKLKKILPGLICKFWARQGPVLRKLCRDGRWSLQLHRQGREFSPDSQDYAARALPCAQHFHLLPGNASLSNPVSGSSDIFQEGLVCSRSKFHESMTRQPAQLCRFVPCSPSCPRGGTWRLRLGH